MEEIVAVDAGTLEEEVTTEEEAASDAEETAVAEKITQKRTISVVCVCI